MLTLSPDDLRLVSPLCVIDVDSIQLRCLSPPGAGRNHAVVVTVNGLASSDPFVNTPVSYVVSPSVVTEIASRALLS